MQWREDISLSSSFQAGVAALGDKKNHNFLTIMRWCVLDLMVVKGYLANGCLLWVQGHSAQHPASHRSDSVCYCADHNPKVSRSHAPHLCSWYGVSSRNSRIGAFYKRKLTHLSSTGRSKLDTRLVSMNPYSERKFRQSMQSDPGQGVVTCLRTMALVHETRYVTHSQSHKPGGSCTIGLER